MHFLFKKSVKIRVNLKKKSEKRFHLDESNKNTSLETLALFMFLNFHVSFFSFPLKLKLKDSFALMLRNKWDQRHQTEQSAGRDAENGCECLVIILIFFYKNLPIFPIREMVQKHSHETQYFFDIIIF